MLIKNPSFKLPTTDNKIVDISDYTGKKIILFMWASWWGCRAQLPVWQDFNNKYSQKLILKKSDRKGITNIFISFYF